MIVVKLRLFLAVATLLVRPASLIRLSSFQSVTFLVGFPFATYSAISRNHSSCELEQFRPICVPGGN